MFSMKHQFRFSEILEVCFKNVRLLKAVWVVCEGKSMHDSFSGFLKGFLSYRHSRIKPIKFNRAQH